MAASTRALVSGSTRGLPLATRDTVCPDTPALAATIAIDTRFACGIRLTSPAPVCGPDLDATIR
ncbi:hypothetical protein GCM10022383_16650 [Microbacterium soli]|uniref:Uncharacterized protein n=1 Tax=Microbacterium soli TaxID=446075 RepID=A0ABP7N9Q1_9MICO